MQSDLARHVASKLTGRRVAVALSGGRDSVVLLHALVRGGADVRAAHVDHGLRADSDDDAAFCRELAANLGISFAVARIVVRRGNSTQGRARAQRYAALVRLAARLGADVLAVAHHADDAWESVVLQTERGAGPVGAAGPNTSSDWWGFDIVRPLLDVRSAQLEEYAKTHRLRWREDPSNQDPYYARVRVRQSDQEFDERALQQRRRDAAALGRDAARIAGVRRPTACVFGRDVLAAAPLPVRARVVLDAARELHGELSGALVDELGAAVADDQRAPRWFCGRRVAVEVSADAVSFHATRGQGTRLLDARATASLVVSSPGEVPWFGGRVVVEPGQVGLTLRGPRAGDRINGHSVFELLSEHGVPPGDRWCWPCFYDESGCVHVSNITNDSTTYTGLSTTMIPR